MTIEIFNKRVDIYDDDVIIWKSSEVKNKEIKNFIKKLCEYKKHSRVLKQNYKLLCAEFLIHNILYSLGFNRVKTETTNLSLYDDMTTYEKIIYKIVSIIF